MLMLKQARMIDPANKVDEIRDILISDRRIVTSGMDLSLDAPLIARAKGERLEILDCSGLIAAPGLVDVHVHLRDPGFTYKEDIHSGSKVAAAGGFTTLVAMANTNPVLDNMESVLYVIRKGKKTDIRIHTCATITKGMQGKELADLKQLKDVGAIGFTDDGLPIMDEEIVKEAMRKARVLKLPLSFHEEDHRFIQESGVNHGRISQNLGLYGANAKAEYTMVERDCRLAKETGATISIQHISSKESVEIVRRAKKVGVRVFAEASPHHFSLTEEAVLEYGTLAKMNPPLRTEEDRMAIIRGLQDNTIEIIATDHAPHTIQEKSQEFIKAPSGIIGLETSLALGIMNLVEPGFLTMSQLLRKMTYEPAKLYGLDVGMLKDESHADIVLFDPNEEWVYERSISKSQNSPWIGKKLKGRVKCTICGGNIIYDNREKKS